MGSLTSEKDEVDIDTGSRPAERGEGREDGAAHHAKCSLSIEKLRVEPAQFTVNDIKPGGDGSLSGDCEVNKWRSQIDRQGQPCGRLEQLAIECIVWRSVCTSESHIIIGNEPKVSSESRVDSPGIQIPFLS